MTDTIEMPCYLIEDDRERAETISDKLHKNGFKNVEAYYKKETYQKAIDTAIKSTQGILICDYDLKDIHEGMRGSSILKSVRTQNQDIILVLYTAFKSIISTDTLKWLADHDVIVYEKGDDVKFALNLRRDVVGGESRSANYLTEKKNNISKVVKDQVLNQLNEIRDKKTEVPVSNGAVYSVQQLIGEVEKESFSGLSYIEDWIKTNLYLGRLKNKRNEQ